MTTTVNLKRLLDRKQWEMVNYAPTAPGSASFICSSNLLDQYQYYVVNATLAYLYDPFEDAWITLPNPSLAGIFGSGACGTRHPHGPRGFPTAGTTTTITTSLNLQRSLAGYTIRIIAGPNAGTDFVIKSNTVGVNSVITITTTAGAAFTTASEFILITGRLWAVSAGTVAAGFVKYYDIATNVWTNATTTGLPATWGTDGKLVATAGTTAGSYITGAVTSSTTTVLTASASTMAVNNWSNYQIRITGGTGAGQFRSIASNTANTITVATAFTVAPDATSTFAIEGNDDYLYLLGNNAVTMYRYSISAAAWTTLAPTVARAAVPTGGMSGIWVSAVTDPSWSIADGSTPYLNGKYIYSFRGGVTNLDRYDIAANSWDNDVVYAPKGDTISSGSSYNYADNYINIALTNTGRFIKYNIAKNLMEPLSQLWYGQSTNILGDRFFDVLFTDGTTKIRYVYFMTHSQTTMFRMMVF